MTATLQRLLFATTVAALGAACNDKPVANELRSPTADALAKPAPDSFTVAFETTKGRFVVRAVRAWAPLGVDRFYYLASNQYFAGTRFFRNLPNFMAQFGIHGDPLVNEAWKDRNLPDDSVRQSNQRGFVTFATGGPNTRTTQLFINKRDNRRLDAMGFAPIGQVTEGMEVVDSLFAGYGEGPPMGAGPDQGRIEREGNSYLARMYPRLDSIISTRILKH